MTSSLETNEATGMRSDDGVPEFDAIVGWGGSYRIVFRCTACGNWGSRCSPWKAAAA